MTLSLPTARAAASLLGYTLTIDGRGIGVARTIAPDRQPCYWTDDLDDALAWIGYADRLRRPPAQLGKIRAYRSRKALREGLGS